MSLSRFFPCFQFQLEEIVNKLDYSNSIFTEGFPHVWQYERTLEELNVTSTRINYFPPQLFYCQGLKVLLANNNNLENIPDAIGSLRQLQQLNLSKNFISNVPDSIKSCKNLTLLDLSCNSLQKLPDAITCLISLQELILNETYLEFLPANFGRLVNLRVVELRSNNLVFLPKSMQRLANLQRLDIGCNEFTKMPEVIGELKQLKELWFDFNQIQTLPLQIGKLRELEHFEANGNCLTCLPNEISNWSNVEVLSVPMNNLTTLPSSIGKLKSLVTLKCESNELAELPGCISNLENLEELVVSHNKLTCLPNTLGMLRKLRYLFADDNNLQKLPDEICSCSLLSVISVSQNKLSALPDNLGHLSNLKVLNIVQNNIATLPVSILSLVNLTSLWISNNQSQPLIPLQYTEISKQRHLTCFMLPQLGSNQHEYSMHNTYGKDSENAAYIEQPTDKAATCSLSKRRICFAEETTILHTDTQTSHISAPTCSENGNYFVLSKTVDPEANVSTSFCEKTEIRSENVNLKDYLMRSPTPYPKELRLMSKYVQLNYQKSLKSNSCDNHPSVSLLENKNCALQKDSNSSYNKLGSYTIGESKISEENHFYNNFDTNPENLGSYSNQQNTENVENYLNKEIHIDLSTNFRQQMVTARSSPKPPPYHIARCFTKKSAEDLTKYEFTRKQLIQSCDPYTDSNNPPQQNSNLDSKNGDTSNNNINFDYQNNLMQREGIEYKVRGKQIVELGDTLDASNALAKRKCNKSKTKWLFGAHKNPRVIQLNINWESSRDFEIDVLPDKEGIFVVSTVSESHASQLIHPLDKLLEVEGVDFTNISINEARQVLRNARPTVSIMLSRK